MPFIRWPDVEILSSQALLTAGATTDAEPLEGLARYGSIGLYVTYTASAGSSNNGRARLSLFWRMNSQEYGAVEEQISEFVVQVRDLPIVNTSQTDRWAIPVINPGGGDTLIVQVNEQGAQANPGTIDIRASVTP